MIEYHEPVLLNDAVKGLKIKPEGIYVDVTFGGGGLKRDLKQNNNWVNCI